MARADTPMGWHAATRGLKLVRGALLGRLVVGVVGIAYSFFVVNSDGDPEAGQRVLLLAYLAAMALAVVGMAWIVVRASRGVVAAGIACACQLVELGAVLVMYAEPMRSGRATFDTMLVAFGGVLIALALATTALAAGARRRDLGNQAEKIGWNFLVVSVLAVLAGALSRIDPGVAIPLILMDAVYGLAMFVALIAVIGKVRDAIQTVAPEPPRAVARIR